tara:strand:+ start:475 stop:1827 length:1353 start_codon:yes stop_codon:yes gene_type:complete
MAQQNTTVGTKVSGGSLEAAEFNSVNSVLNANATDAQSRTVTLETASADYSSRLTTIEATSIPIQSYTTENLPASATTGTIALDTTIGFLIYHKNGSWYKLFDNSLDVFVTGFVFTVNTANAGTSNSDQFTIPTVSGNSYNYTVDWGDSTTDSYTTDAAPTKTYAAGAGTYTITITGAFQGVAFNGGGDKLKLTEISNMGAITFAADATGAFYGCENLQVPAGTTGPDTSATTDFQWFWRDCELLIPPLMDTSSGVTFFGAFRDCFSMIAMPALDFTGVPNSGNSTAFRDTFRNCTSLLNFDAVTWGDVGTDMRTTFDNCSSLTAFPAINTARVTGMRETFRGCSTATTFPAYTTSNVASFQSAWSGCSALTTFPVLDFSSATVFTDAWLNCALNSASVDNILAALVAGGAASLTTSLAGGTAIAESSWSTQAQADVATLRANGWTVSSN